MKTDPQTTQERMDELLEELHYLVPTTAATAIECVSEWIQRHDIDGRAYEAALTKHDAGPAELYAEAALLQIMIEGLR